MKNGTSGVRKRRLVVLLAVVAATGLGVLAAGAVAQVDTTPSGNGVTATAEVTTSQTITGEVATTQEVVPAGGTAAGAGGTAQDGPSLLPILLGVAGLGMLLVAAGFARRRRFD